MVHRTHLTSPPGVTPVLESDVSSELYTPGLGVPVEPTVPMRHRGKVIAAVVVSGLVLSGWVAFRIATSGQDFDPSLDVQVEEFDPTIPSGPTGG